MSVLKAFQKESTAQFVTSANELKLFTARTVVLLSDKFKSHNEHANTLARAIADDLIRANGLYVSRDRPENYPHRITLYDRVLGNLNCLSSHIVFLCELADTFNDNAKKKPKITDKRWLNWASKINTVKGLVAKIRDSDIQKMKQSLGT